MTKRPQRHQLIHLTRATRVTIQSFRIISNRKQSWSRTKQTASVFGDTPTVELNAKFFWIATIHLRSTLQKSEFWNYCKKMLTQKKYFVLCDSKLNPIDDNDEASDRALVADWVNGFSKETQHSSTMWHLNWKCENHGFDAPFRSANN